METKVCKYCDNEKELSFYRPQTRECRECVNKKRRDKTIFDPVYRENRLNNNKKYYLTEKGKLSVKKASDKYRQTEKAKECTKKYRSADGFSEKNRKYSLKHYHTHKKERLLSSRKIQIKNKEAINIRYVASIYRLKTSEVTPEILELGKKTINLYRFLKSKKVILNTQTGIFYNSPAEASKSCHISARNLIHYMTIAKKNKSNFIYC